MGGRRCRIAATHSENDSEALVILIIQRTHGTSLFASTLGHTEALDITEHLFTKPWSEMRTSAIGHGNFPQIYRCGLLGHP